jgi:metallo-beta-lactamase class B
MQTKKIALLSLVFFVGVTAYGEHDNERIRLCDDVEVRQLAEGIWLHTTYFDIEGYENVPANGIIIIDSNEAIMIDLPWTDEQTGVLFDWVEKKQNSIVKKVVPTHWHIDSSGGLAEAHRRKAESFAFVKTVELLKANDKPAPVNWFTDRLSLSCGGTRVELAYFGPGHTVDNIVAWIPTKNILFGGDLFRTRNARNLGNLAEADVKSWPETLKKVKQTYPKAKVVIPCHGPYGGMELIDHTITLCDNQK